MKYGENYRSNDKNVLNSDRQIKLIFNNLKYFVDRVTVFFRWAQSDFDYRRGGGGDLK